MGLTVRPVAGKADRKAFVDLAYRLNAGDPHWVPPLKSEVAGTIDPKKNGWFSHAEGQLFLAEREGKAVGRISAHIDSSRSRCRPSRASAPAPASGGCSRPRTRMPPRR